MGCAGCGTYNTLVQKDTAVEEAWANVETSYQRRADLIPNLVSTVQGAADFELEKSLPCPFERTMALAQIATRLRRMSDGQQDRLINWGYAVTDAALRKHVDPSLPVGRFPYPDSAV